MKFGKVGLIFLTLVLLSVAVFRPVLGQAETILTLRPPSWMVDVFDEELLGRFTADHPGVKVVLVRGDDQEMYYSPAAYGVEDHLDGAEKYVASADVLYIGSNNLSPEATRAGYFLDLAPLVNSDIDLNPDDFFPGIWEAFQWDRGIWGLPVSASVQVVIYSVDAFDNAGLPYPDEGWTLDDYINAARTLTEKNEDGTIKVPGMETYNVGLLFRSLLGRGVYDDTVIPYAPDFNQPELAAMLEAWLDLTTELQTDGSYDYNAVPLRFEQTWRLTNIMPDNDTTWAASLLPNGVAGLDVQGFAVSSGTQNPELAYELAKFLSNDAEVSALFYGDTPARQSLVGVELEDSLYFRPELPEDVQTLIDRAVENGVPGSALMYSDYVNLAAQKISSGEMDAVSALQEAEKEAVEAQDTALARLDTGTVLVATPQPTPVMAEGQIVLKFGLNLMTSNTASTEEWNRLIEDFRAANPDVGNIDLVSQMVQNTTEEMDCYYQPNNAVPDLDLTTVLNLDPFMDADPGFDETDFMGNALQLVQRDDRVWAYPMVIQPAVLWYNSESFANAGVPEPVGDWTVDAFKDALELLQQTAENDKPVFEPQSFNNTYLLLLMAGYGAIPYDYRTNPPALNLSDPDGREAMRQVLDLAKEGYMAYQELATLGGGGFGSSGDVPLYGDALSTITWRLQNRTNPDIQDPYLLTNYPHGSQNVPVAFDMGTAYINATTQNPDACYRWITTIAQRPDLLSGIPVRRSLLSDSQVALAQGEDVTALYQEFANKLDDPNAVIFPSQYGSSGSVGSFVELLWVNRAFDNYVLHDGDLDADLNDAELFINTYRECAAEIAPLDVNALASTDDALAYIRQYTDCALTVDPTLDELFAFIYQGQE
ncbi:MAG TPA: extracellular solute-binding protein [Phototrophicaceae bacterium]|nr:extracellular solute-binding protein [Phototrophicaceae bacterium]